MNTRTIHLSFALVSIISLALVLWSFRQGFNLSGIAITIGLLAFFWYWAASKQPRTSVIIASQALILLDALGNGFSLYSTSIAGITYDSYMHLIAAFVAALLALAYFGRRKHAVLYTGLVVFGLGLGVEVVEILDKLVLGSGFAECADLVCHYWQDTIKDLINDALGIGFALISSRS